MHTTIIILHKVKYSILDSMKSTVAIKNIEIDRHVVSPTHRTKNKNNTTNNCKSSTIIDYSDEEEEMIWGDDPQPRICGDIQGDLHKHIQEHILCDLKAVPRKKNSNYANKIKNDKPPKKPMTLSKIRLKWKTFFGIAEV
jgi:hypothetical protein